jgi:hypothetical protein
MEPDFSGWATKAGLKCSDGRTITPQAFQHMDGVKVPLVWSHGHNSPDNVLGHVLLEAKPQGVRCQGFFNDTKQGQSARVLVQHKDIDSLSIFANQLVEKAHQVIHGMIREVSLVLSGANPEAKIDYVRIQHSDDPSDFTESTDAAIIHTDEFLDGFVENEDVTEEEIEHAAQTVRDIYDTMNPEQQQAVHYMIAVALEGVGQSDIDSKKDDKNEGDLEHEEGTEGEMTSSRNLFERNGKKDGKADQETYTLTHEDVKGITADALRTGSLKTAVHNFALAHGIENIDVLFPDAKNVSGTPEFDKRRTEWVAGVLNGATHRPFARIKTMSADITVEEARAKGYVKGSLKKEEFFAVQKRTTAPTTVYKKQKLDRDDIVDITEFDIVSWLKGEIRLMLEEELARAILIGDGRDVGHEDKIKDPAGTQDGIGIRSIANDHELYVAKVYVNIDDANSDYYEIVEQVLRGRRFYKGTGTPTFYTTENVITEMLLTKDAMGRRRFQTVEDIARELRVSSVVAVEAMEDDYAADILGIMVNLQDYSTGTDRGGEINMFDDFDIDYNQFKYLMETRLSGALTKIRSAVVFHKTAGANVLVHPITSPTFVESTGVVTIPTQTGVVYKNKDTSATLSAGAQSALAAGATLNVIATPASGYFFESNVEDEWSFTRPAA